MCVISYGVQMSDTALWKLQFQSCDCYLRSPVCPEGLQASVNTEWNRSEDGLSHLKTTSCSKKKSQPLDTSMLEVWNPLVLQKVTQAYKLVTPGNHRSWQQRNQQILKHLFADVETSANKCFNTFTVQLLQPWLLGVIMSRSRPTSSSACLISTNTKVGLLLHLSSLWPHMINH